MADVRFFGVGCDISIFAEAPSSQGWVCVEAPSEACSCDGGGCELCVDPGSPLAIGIPGRRAGSWYSVRHSLLFAALCGFRNDFGIEPIAAARGFPADVSSRVAEVASRWGDDVVRPSWLTLAEVERWPGWDVPVPISGWMTGDDLRRRSAGATWGFARRTFLPEVSEAELRRLVALGDPRATSVAASVTIEETLRDSAAIFLDAL